MWLAHGIKNRCAVGKELASFLGVRFIGNKNSLGGKNHGERIVVKHKLLCGFFSKKVHLEPLKKLIKDWHSTCRKFEM